MQSNASTVHLVFRSLFVFVLLSLCFFGAQAVGRRCIVTSTSIRPTSWTIEQKQENILFRISIPDESRYEDDPLNFFQSISLTFDNACNDHLSFTAVVDKGLNFSLNSNWTVRYQQPLDATDCGTFLFERLLPIANAVKNNACFKKIPMSDVSSFQVESFWGRIKRAYGVTTRTFATSRFLEDNVQFMVNVTHVNPSVFGAVELTTGVSIHSSEIAQNALETYSIRVIAHTNFPQLLQVTSDAQNSISVASNCSNFNASNVDETIKCEHIITGTSFRASPCLATSDYFTLVVRATCLGAAQCPFEGPFSIVLTPESSGCTLSGLVVTKISTQLLPVRGPVADPSGALAWSSLHKPLIPAGYSGYFMVDIMPSPGKSSIGRLLSFHAHLGDKTIQLQSEQDTNDPFCRRDRVCIYVSQTELQQLVTSNAYTTLSFSASVEISLPEKLDQTIIASSSTIADILSPTYADSKTYTQPPYERFHNDTLGFSIAIAAGLVVLIAALVGFAVSFRSQPAVNPQTGPTAAGAAV